MALLSVNNTKTLKGEKFGYLTFILNLAPAKLSGYNTCPMASLGCTNACLNLSGLAVFSNVQSARIAKTKRYFEDRENFVAELFKEIAKAKKTAAKKGLKLAIRINGTSDIPELALRCAREFTDVQFYDYTKIVKTLFRDDLPENYSLTFSRSESNELDVAKALAIGGNVAMVFAGQLPESYKGVKVVDGDISDLRFLDEKGVIVGLSTKGKAKKDTSGFVIQA